MLVGFVLHLNRIQLYLNFEKPLLPTELEKWRELLKKRVTHEPLQYIIGEVEFYSLKFKVNKHTLIPRPETELLVDVALDICRTDYKKKDKIDILDIGTGSGNIATALTKNNDRIWVTAIDIYSAALEIAKENAKSHGVSERITFLLQDIYKNFADDFLTFDLIVSNPPYITKQEKAALPAEVKNFEPVAALYGGEDGLKYYFRIIELVPLLKEDGRIAVEIGAFQAEQIVNIFSSNNKFRHIEVFKDLNKKDRVILALK